MFLGFVIWSLAAGIFACIGVSCRVRNNRCPDFISGTEFTLLCSDNACCSDSGAGDDDCLCKD